MSHLKERTEKNCLNCNATLYGRFCHVCGQENIEPKDNFWHLVTHFAYDVIHFDGKFFNTARYLLLRPGYLSLEYMRGRRADFLHPIRMYIFVSAFFFLTFLSFFKGKDDNDVMQEKTPGKNATTTQIIENLKEKRAGLEAARNAPAMPAKAIRKLDSKIAVVDSELARIARDTTGKLASSYANADDDDTAFTTVEAYDAAQRMLPASKRDGWLERLIARRQIKLKQEYHTNASINEHLREKFWHSIPQLLFISLPLVALILELLYIRHTRQFYYVSHVIYVIHLYCALFILLFITFLLGSFTHISWLHWLSWVQAMVWLYMLFYLFRSMKVFYTQGTGKTIAKMLLMLLTTFITIGTLFVVFVVVFVYLLS